MEYDVWVESVKTQPLPREKLISPILQVFLTPRFSGKKKKNTKNIKKRQSRESERKAGACDRSTKFTRMSAEQMRLEHVEHVPCEVCAWSTKYAEHVSWMAYLKQKRSMN